MSNAPPFVTPRVRCATSAWCFPFSGSPASKGSQHHEASGMCTWNECHARRIHDIKPTFSPLTSLPGPGPLTPQFFPSHRPPPSGKCICVLFIGWPGRHLLVSWDALPVNHKPHGTTNSQTSHEQIRRKIETDQARNMSGMSSSSTLILGSDSAYSSELWAVQAQD